MILKSWPWVSYCLDSGVLVEGSYQGRCDCSEGIVQNVGQWHDARILNGTERDEACQQSGWPAEKVSVAGSHPACIRMVMRHAKKLGGGGRGEGGGEEGVSNGSRCFFTPLDIV